jgi:polar amino acid transport system substrate-binding protein
MQIERSAIPRGLRVRLASHGVAVVLLGLVAAMSASAATLDRIRESGKVRLGYLADARPFSFGTASGADGYSVSLCKRVVEELKAQPGLADVDVDLVAVEGDDRLREVAQGGVDLLCAPVSVTLERRQQVSFSVPIYAGGVRAVVRADAPLALRQALGETPVGRPVWRGSPAATVLGKSSFGVVSGTTTERWLADRLTTFHIDAKSVAVPDYGTGVQQLLDRKIDVFFGDPSLVLGAIDPASTGKVVILERMLTHEPLALALARNDDDFRLLVDRALSKAYSSDDFPTLYRQWFGDFPDSMRLFFLWNTPVQ